VFVLLKQRIHTIKVETDVSMHNEEGIFGMENDAIYEAEVSHILR